MNSELTQNDFAKLPKIYSIGGDKLRMKDGTEYSGIMGSFMVRDVKAEPSDGDFVPAVWSSSEEATGHLREALDSGLGLVYLNLRPGYHHVMRIEKD